MPSVIFIFSDGSRVETEAYSQLNLLAHAQIIERSLQSRCGGHAECGTCRVAVLSGVVSPIRPEEEALLNRIRRIKSNSEEISAHGGELRLSCQCFPEGPSDVVVQVPGKPSRDLRD